MKMLKTIALVPAVLVGVLLCGGAVASTEAPLSGGVVMPRTLELKAGDVIVLRDGSGWKVVKILAVDAWPDGTSVAHSLMYDETADRPVLAATAALPVKIGYAPIRAGSFAEEGWERLGNLPVTPTEAEGFLDYLKETDFPRYLEETGVSVEEVVGAANRLYQQGNTLSEAGDHEGAIAAYDRAIELFPLFFEAIDNRAFSYMDLGRYDVALQGFEASLRVEPGGIAAFFSRGECLLRLGRFEEAEAVFLEGQDRFPERRSMFTEFLDLTRSARAKAG